MNLNNHYRKITINYLVRFFLLQTIALALLICIEILSGLIFGHQIIPQFINSNVEVNYYFVVSVFVWLELSWIGSSYFYKKYFFQIIRFVHRHFIPFSFIALIKLLLILWAPDIILSPIFVIIYYL